MMLARIVRRWLHVTSVSLGMHPCVLILLIYTCSKIRSVANPTQHLSLRLSTWYPSMDIWWACCTCCHCLFILFDFLLIVSRTPVDHASTAYNTDNMPCRTVHSLLLCRMLCYINSALLLACRSCLLVIYLGISTNCVPFGVICVLGWQWNMDIVAQRLVSNAASSNMWPQTALEIVLILKMCRIALRTNSNIFEELLLV